jgi:N-acetylglucosamine malate deacetylase 2
VLTRTLATWQRALKRAMLDAFVTQRSVLAALGVEDERFRIAPRYDFSRPPHAGLVHYEQLGWPMRARDFCELAGAALDALAVRTPPSRVVSAA